MRDQVPAAASVGAAPEAAALAALPNSAMRHLGATTTPEQFFFDLLQPAAMQVLDEEDDIWADAYAPLLGLRTLVLMSGFSGTTRCVRYSQKSKTRNLFKQRASSSRGQPYLHVRPHVSRV